MKISYGQSILRRMVSHLTGGAKIVDNYRPQCLEGLEIDVWLPDFNIGFEFDGDQHVIPVFGTEALIRQCENDSDKILLCKKHGIGLIRIDASSLSLEGIDKKIFWFFIKANHGNGRFEAKRSIASRYRDAVVVNGPSPDHPLDAEAFYYRQLLLHKFASPLALPVGSRRKKALACALSSSPKEVTDKLRKIKLLHHERLANSGSRQKLAKNIKSIFSPDVLGLRSLEICVRG